MAPQGQITGNFFSCVSKVYHSTLNTKTVDECFFFVRYSFFAQVSRDTRHFVARSRAFALHKTKQKAPQMQALRGFNFVLRTPHCLRANKGLRSMFSLVLIHYR